MKRSAFPTLLLVIAGIFFTGPSASAGRTLSLPRFQGRPGEIVPMPILLDDATSLAAARLQINFDPQLLALITIRQEGLGAAFTLHASTEAGVATLMLTRPTALTAGSGRLAVLEFRVNPGATPGMTSELPIANCELSDETGLHKLHRTESLTLQAGAVAVTLGPVDNNANRIPDDWEMAHALSFFAADPAKDTDGDGWRDFLEYALGLDPQLSEPAITRLRTREITVGDGRYLVLEFARRRSLAFGLQYRVEESPNLASWSLVDPETNLLEPPLDLGDGFEWVRLRGNLPISGPGAIPAVYMRLRAYSP